MYKNMFLPLKNKMFLIFQFFYLQSKFPFKKLQYERNRGKLPMSYRSEK
ncbi:hypothetical protein LEP1GSC087_0205 [Leptospira interrogans serovar Bataviae str. L1111]|nr:hypothetical protein LEP1GSC087_0205 [Leptospira interrogans serovar Bataviae str. L1111]